VRVIFALCSRTDDRTLMSTTSRPRRARARQHLGPRGGIVSNAAKIRRMRFKCMSLGDRLVSFVASPCANLHVRCTPRCAAASRWRARGHARGRQHGCPNVDNAMVEARARAFRWRRLLDEGAHATIEYLGRARASRRPTSAESSGSPGWRRRPSAHDSISPASSSPAPAASTEALRRL
jgi:hypothetical protein